MQKLLLLAFVLLFVMGCGEKASEKIIGVWKLVVDEGKEPNTEYIEITPNLLIIADKDKIPVALVDKDAKAVTSDVGGMNFIFTLDEKDELILSNSKLFGSSARHYIRSDKASANNYYKPPMAMLLGYWLNDDGVLAECGNDYFVISDQSNERQSVDYQSICCGYLIKLGYNRYEMRIAENNTMKLKIDWVAYKTKTNTNPNFKRITAEAADKIRAEQKLVAEKIITDKKLAEEKILADKKLIAEQAAKELAEKLAPLDKVKGMWVKIIRDDSRPYKQRMFLEITDTELKFGHFLEKPTAINKITDRKIIKNLPSFIGEDRKSILSIVNVSADGNTFTASNSEYQRITPDDCAVVNKPTMANLNGYWVLNDRNADDECKLVVFSGDKMLRDGWLEKISAINEEGNRSIYLRRQFEKMDAMYGQIIFYDNQNIGISWNVSSATFTEINRVGNVETKVISYDSTPPTNYRRVSKEGAERIFANTTNYVSQLSGYWRSKDKVKTNREEDYAYLAFTLNIQKDDYLFDRFEVTKNLTSDLDIGNGFITYYGKKDLTIKYMADKLATDEKYARILRFAPWGNSPMQSKEMIICVIDKDTIRVINFNFFHSALFIRIPESEAAELLKRRKK